MECARVLPLDAVESEQVDAVERLVDHVRQGQSLLARGLFIRVAHAQGLDSLYVHLGEYTVETGQRVRRGQLLGRVGLTGVHASDAHLHFGLFDGEVVLDPMRYLAPHILTNAPPTLDLTRLQQRLTRASRRP
ncbi:MAG: M23 family metallopeptidase [Myxococcales bacterium]|nr:M23 family metallopeptidase [Myxococcales bacterium]